MGHQRRGMGWRDSALEFAGIVFKSYKALVAGITVVILGIVDVFADVPVLLWVVALGLLLLTANFVAFHQVRLERERLIGSFTEALSMKELREELARYLQSGNEIIFIMELTPGIRKGVEAVAKSKGKKPPVDDNKQPMWREMYSNWLGTTEAFLRATLGTEYVSRFQTKVAGLDPDVSQFEPEMQRFAASVKHRQARIEEFMNEFR